jgi:hypothetical protein
LTPKTENCWNMWYLVKIEGISIKNEIGSNEPNGLFRWLSKGHSTLGRVTNRMFFKKYVEGGYYRNNLIDGKIDFIFYLKVKEGVDLVRFEKGIRYRIRKKVFNPIEVKMVSPDEIPPLKYRRFYQSFGCYYGKFI